MEEQDGDYRVRQENEFLLLKSVYDKELVDLRQSKDDDDTDCTPPEMIITLVPQQSTSCFGEVYVQVDLYLKLSAKYPDVIPEISIRNVKGLSVENVDKLQRELVALATSLRGEVMILELAQKVHVYLRDYNVPRPQYKDTSYAVPRHGSFYEEMLSNQRRLEEEKAKELKRKSELKREAIRVEIQRKQEEIREEGRLRKELSKQIQISSPIETNFDVRTGDGSPVTFTSPVKDKDISPLTEAVSPHRRGKVKSDSLSSQESLRACCDHGGTTLLKFTFRGVSRTVQRGRCLGHSSRGSVVFSGLDLGTGELVTVTEWCLKWRHSTCEQDQDCDVDAENCMKHLAMIEQEMSSLCKLQHKNLVHYLGISYTREKDRIVVLVLQEFVSGGSLAYYLLESIPVEYELLQFYVSGILEALSFLHRNSVVHKDLRDSCVFVKNKGTVCVADYSLEKRLSELHSTLVKEETKDVFPVSVGRGGKKADIYRLGILCLSFVNGSIPNSIIPEVPLSLPPVLCDFLEKCLNRNESERFTADQLLEHPFLKSSIGKALELRNFDLINAEAKTEERGDAGVEVTEIPAEPCNSRLRNEFEVMLLLGRGGFGDVYKVRNKLDGRIYAIKRIGLNPSNKQINRKITREVKLLSRLNHENVVRYFNSWMETRWVERSASGSNDSSDEVDGSVSCTESRAQPHSRSNTFGFRQSRPALDNSDDCSIVFERSSRQQSLLNDEDSSEDEEDVFGTSFMPTLDDSKEKSPAENSKSDSASADVVDGGKAECERHCVQFLYIQMEFCDRSTLRSAIDDKLYMDKCRVWRLFREVVEGLAHIHEQGMIHRDVKPVNIFLDSSDHVKIGDFGLATMDVFARVETTAVPCPREANKIMVDLEMSEQGVGDTNMTSWVGTYLYVSPEVTDQNLRNYNLKVDVYSLGIILFEMLHPPLTTAMERVKVLNDIRKPEIVFPEESQEIFKPKEVTMIRWMLNHNPIKRPSTSELLQSPLLPPPQIEEAKLHDVFRHTINNPRSKIYKYMISALFEQRVTTADDITYDMELHKGTFSGKVALTHKYVTDTLVKIFEKHGGISFHIPLLMPKSEMYMMDDGYVRLIDHGGGVVSLPYDLRLPFCRYVVRNNICQLKWYFISPVYRERKVFGCHPKELHACAFDVITPSPGCLIADAEVMAMMWEVLSHFQPFQDRSCVLRLNHASILSGILLHFGIAEDRHPDICTFIKDAKNKNSYRSGISQLFGVSEDVASTLHQLIEAEGAIDVLAAKIKSVVRRKDRAASLVDEGFKQLEMVIANLEAFGISAASVVVSPNLVYGIRYFSGVIFHFCCALMVKKRRKFGGLDVLAAGGRYDKLVEHLRCKMDITGTDEVSQSAVGVSIAVEKLVLALLECDEFHPPGAFDVLVCSIRHRDPQKQKLCAVASELWGAGISAYLHYDPVDTLQEIHELCLELRASHIVTLKDGDGQNVRLRTVDKEKFTERFVLASSLVDVLQKLIASRRDSQESVPQATGSFKADSHRSDLRSQLGELPTSVDRSSSSNMCITFATVDKLAACARRRHEAQILTNLAHLPQLFSSKASTEIVAVELGAQILTTVVASVLPTADEVALEASIEATIEKHSRYKKQLMKLGDHLHHLIFNKKKSVIIMYSLTDSCYRILM